MYNLKNFQQIIIDFLSSKRKDYWFDDTKDRFSTKEIKLNELMDRVQSMTVDDIRKHVAEEIHRIDYRRSVRTINRLSMDRIWVIENIDHDKNKNIIIETNRWNRISIKFTKTLIKKVSSFWIWDQVAINTTAVINESWSVTFLMKDIKEAQDINLNWF